MSDHESSTPCTVGTMQDDADREAREASEALARARFSARIKQLLGDQFQNELSAQLGVAPGSVGKYKKGHADPRLTQLVWMASRAGVSVAWLIGESDDGGPTGQLDAGAVLEATEAEPPHASGDGTARPRAQRRRRSQGG